MAVGLIGRKRGMTRIFGEDGNAVPVTVLEVAPNRVTQLRTDERDGYRAVQVTTGAKRRKLLNKAEAGHYASAGVEPGEGLWEFRLDDDSSEELECGSELTVDRFASGQFVQIAGTSKGKGFAGTVKRHNFHTQDATHGNSLAHRAPGSIGQCQTPGRVFKGKKMAGHMGDERVTTKGLEIVRVDAERNLLLVRGAVPGAAGGHVVIHSAAS